MINYFEESFNDNFLYLYLLMAFCAIFVIIETFVRKKKTTNVQWFLLILFSVLFTLMLGTRNINVGNDTITYINFYLDQTTLPDFGFNYFNNVMYQFGVSVDSYILIIAFLYMFFLIYFIKLTKVDNIFLLFFCFVSLFFFKSMGVNIIRTGVAMSFFLCAFISKNKKFKYVFFLLSISFHSSFIIPILGYFGVYFLKSVRIPLVIYIISIFLSIINIQIYFWIQKIPVVNLVFYDKIASYSNIDKSSYTIGFRYDFFLFNLFFAVVGYFGYKIYNNDIRYKRTYYLYLILSGFFYIMFNSGFSDRYGLFSWSLIPILLLPFLESKKLEYILMNKYIILIVCFCTGLFFYGFKKY